MSNAENHGTCLICRNETCEILLLQVTGARRIWDSYKRRFPSGVVLPKGSSQISTVSVFTPDTLPGKIQVKWQTQGDKRTLLSV